eukprot:Gb_34938 [translate_table: standard]
MAKSTGKKRKRAESLLTEKADVVPESKPALDNELKKKKKKKKKKKADCPEIKMDISPAGNKNQESETVTPLESLKSGEYNNRTNREIFKGQLNKTGIFYVKGKLFDGLLEKLSRSFSSVDSQSTLHERGTILSLPELVGTGVCPRFNTLKFWDGCMCWYFGDIRNRLMKMKTSHMTQMAS